MQASFLRHRFAPLIVSSVRQRFEDWENPTALLHGIERILSLPESRIMKEKTVLTPSQFRSRYLGGSNDDFDDDGSADDYIANGQIDSYSGAPSSRGEFLAGSLVSRFYPFLLREASD